MAFIIPDKILETLICDSCQKYLSVKPIKVYPNRRVKCGRCSRSKKQSDGVISLYGLIAEKSLFKCVNRFDGCRELLTYSQVRDHERVCLGKMYKCPICPEHSEIATFLLIKHFREEHKDAVLDVPAIIFNPNVPSETSRIYFYQEDDNLFFLDFCSSRLEETIRLSLKYVGDSKVAKNIHQEYNVSNESKILDFNSKPKSCASFGIPHCDYISVKVSDVTDMIFIKFKVIYKDLKLLRLPDGIDVPDKNLIGSKLHHDHVFKCDKLNFTPMVKSENVRKISLSTKFYMKYPKYSLSKCCTAITDSQIEYYLNCYNCQEICWRGLSQDISVQGFYYSTTFRHSICYYCFQMLKYEKKVSENDYMISNFPKDMVKEIYFFCKWNCGEYFNAQYHLGHEESCKMQPLKRCPGYNCLFRGTVVELAQHILLHPNREICAYSSFYISSMFDRNIYVYLQNQFIYFKVVSNQGISIKVEMVEHEDSIKVQKWKPIVLLFDDNKNFLLPFHNSITKNEANHWVKIILTKEKT